MSAPPGPVPAAGAVAPAAGVEGARISRAGVLRSEWLKLRSLRSMLLTALLAAGSMILLAVVGATDFAYDFERATGAQRSTLDPSQSLLSGWFLAQVVVGVVGALAVTSEYASGSIAATLAAAPRRTPVLAAKLAVPSSAALLVMIPSTVAGILLGNLLLPGAVSVDIGDRDLLRAILGIGLAMAAVCAIGTALGFIVRSTAGTIAILVVVLMVLPGLVAGLSERLYQLLPSGVIESLVTIDRATNEEPLLAWPAGVAVLAAYVVAAAGGALWVLRRRDA